MHDDSEIRAPPSVVLPRLVSQVAQAKSENIRLYMGNYSAQEPHSHILMTGGSE